MSTAAHNDYGTFLFVFQSNTKHFDSHRLQNFVKIFITHKTSKCATNKSGLP